MSIHTWWSISLALVAAIVAFESNAQIVVSANDNKAILVDGNNVVPDKVDPDTVSIIDLNALPPKLIAEIQAPASVVGPPSSVAVAPDESFALVTSATKLSPSDPKKTAPDNRVSVIDLKASPPLVTQTVEAGAGAAGVAINRTGTLALVANRSEGTVSVFKISGKSLMPAGAVQLGDSKSGPSAVSFAPDGKTALVTRDGDHRISVLSIDGDKVAHSKRDMAAGLRPYPLDITPNGRHAVISNIGVGLGDNDTLSLIDLQASPARVVDTVSVGQTPEGLSISPDGNFVAVSVMNGSNRAKSSPFFNDFGLVRIFRIDGNKLTPVADGRVGNWCQGSAWSRDSKTLLVQCPVQREIQVFAFSGQELRKTGAIAVNGAPVGIATARR